VVGFRFQPRLTQGLVVRATDQPGGAVSVGWGEDFLCVFKPGRHGLDAPPLAPASAHSRSASAPGGWRATGVVVLPWLRPGEEAPIMRSHPPA
jgi:hypothetical protein